VNYDCDLRGGGVSVSRVAQNGSAPPNKWQSMALNNCRTTDYTVTITPFDYNNNTNICDVSQKTRSLFKWSLPCDHRQRDDHASP